MTLQAVILEIAHKWILLATHACPAHLVDELVLVFYASLWLG